jgi:hypothetical protein
MGKNDGVLYAYRIKHIPTELFYQPTRGRWAGEKSNLSERGKVYLNRLPPLPEGSPYISNALCKKFDIADFMLDQRKKWNPEQKCIKIFSKHDWKIIKYKLVEVKND